MAKKEVTLLQARVPVDLLRRVKVKAAQEDTSLQALVVEALENLLRRRGKERDEK